MSDDLIKRSDAIDAMRDTLVAAEIPYAVNALFKVPSADIPQGEWTQSVFRSDIYRYECSNCKAHHRARYDFCPSCGARMKGADDDI